MITAHPIARASSSEETDARAGALAGLRPRLLGERQAAELADTFAVLGDPTRVRLVDALAHGELCVSDLAAVVGLTESAVSHQLRLLRGMRLVRARRAGRLMYYTLDDDHIIELLRLALTHVQE